MIFHFCKSVISYSEIDKIGGASVIPKFLVEFFLGFFSVTGKIEDCLKNARNCRCV